MLRRVIPHATLLYGSLNALLFVALSANVSRTRAKTNTWLSDAVPPEVHRASRAHGNFAESAALATVLLLAIELGGASATVAHIFGGTYVVLRILHAAGTLMKSSISVVGAMGTLVLLLAMVVYALMLHGG